jgi:hypothetical protein
VQVEAGKKYVEFRGVMFDGDVEILRDREAIIEIDMAVAYRYGLAPAGAPPELVRAEAPRRAEPSSWACASAPRAPSPGATASSAAATSL